MEPRVIPLAQVVAGGYVEVKDNTEDFSGAIVHPQEGEGLYMAPLSVEDVRAYATRLHEYIHLQLITSGIQPTGLHKAFEKAGIVDSVLQAIADAKVMTYAMSRELNLEDLIVISSTEEYARDAIKQATKLRQANLLLRSINTKLYDFAYTSVALTEAKKKFILEIFEQIKTMRTLKDWVKLGLEYQSAFDTPKLKKNRSDKASLYVDTPKAEETTKTRMTRKKAVKQQEEIAERITEEVEKEEEEESERKKELKEEKGSSSLGGGTAVSEHKKELKIKTEGSTGIPTIKQEAEEVWEELDQSVLRARMQNKKDFIETATSPRLAELFNPGKMIKLTPRLEKPFEPKARSKKIKRSFVGAFKFPHRLVTDSAVFACKQRGKGGTLLIDCSGSMHLSWNDISQVLEQRPFATIAIYASVVHTFNEGHLIIVVDRGKQITKEELAFIMDHRLGCGNVIDIPALQWLCRTAGEKFWICDGMVTGRGDCSHPSLSLAAALLERRYKVKRWSNLKDFIANKAPNYG